MIFDLSKVKAEFYDEESITENMTINKTMKIFPDARTDRGYSIDNVYFKVIIKGRYDVRVKFKEPEYVFHGDALMFNDSEREALVDFFKGVDGKSNWVRLINLTNDQLKYNMVNNKFRIPTDLAIPDYMKLKVVKAKRNLV